MYEPEDEDGAIIIDFTSFKLIDMLSKEESPTRILILEALIEAYVDGRVDIKRKGGEPYFYDPKRTGARPMGIDDVAKTKG